MKPSAFEMVRPRTLAEALALLEHHGDEARLIAGGQTLVPMMNLRIASPAVLIDLNTVEGLAGIHHDGDVLRIGAMTRQQMVVESDVARRCAPLVVAAAHHIGHYSTRNRGTVGGSLANADPSSELALAMVTLGAEFLLTGGEGQRTVAARDFFLDALTTALEPAAILTQIIVPVAPVGTEVAFREHARRHGDFATASAAVQLSPREGVLLAGLGAIGPVPVVCHAIQEAFAQGDLLANLDALVTNTVSAIDAIEDVHTSADYRRRLAAVCLTDCIRELIA